MAETKIPKTFITNVKVVFEVTRKLNNPLTVNILQMSMQNY